MPAKPRHKKPSSHISKHKKVKTSRGLVRIIAGTHRGRRLPVLVHEGLRPTGDRVKETLFNWLMAEVEGAVCLDMYAGSGSLGIEALSRGAKHVVFIEQDRTVSQQITDNLTTLRELDKAAVLNQSALSTDLDASGPFDIVFIDPPFGKDMVEQSIKKLLVEGTLAPNAHIYIETGHNDDYTLPPNFALVKQIKTSQVFACLYKFEA
ncbi:16S rRNA (guanine(966)-N(2))-methyltransferase RsmD [Glaciecola sp. MF2-115]|uniref:16S rRNA (guanine(966)-N(2))-methyltransferase RsmD n=1 Tax=Glaciecola sp. MF2-115 TaxID=3384827 RepID=UPI0039A3C31E